MNWLQRIEYSVLNWLDKLLSPMLYYMSKRIQTLLLKDIKEVLNEVDKKVDK